MAKIYLASSWKNQKYPEILAALQEAGHEVYDFRKDGFEWSTAGTYETSGIDYFLQNLESDDTALVGFHKDRVALNWCDVCVLLLPCGRSAHLEAGYAAGQGKKVIFFLDEEGFIPELMYLLGDGFVKSMEALRLSLRGIEGDQFRGVSYTIDHDPKSWATA